MRERIPVQAQHVLYLTLALSFLSSSLVPFAFSWRKKKKKKNAQQNVLLCRTAGSINTAKPEEPTSSKRVTVWTIRTKDGRKVKWYIRGNVCQVQSAWKLPVPWRADESQRPNRTERSPNLVSTQMWNWSLLKTTKNLWKCTWLGGGPWLLFSLFRVWVWSSRHKKIFVQLMFHHKQLAESSSSLEISNTSFWQGWNRTERTRMRESTLLFLIVRTFKDS